MAEQKLLQEPTADSRNEYTVGDKLAIALACMAGIMAIILYLVDKTPSVVLSLLILMMAFAVYPAIHFFRNKLTRLIALVVFAIFVVVFGFAEWPKPQAQTSGSSLQDSEHLKQPVTKLDSSSSAPARSNTVPSQPIKPLAKPSTKANKTSASALGIPVAECPPNAMRIDMDNVTATGNGLCGIKVEGNVCLIMHGQAYLSGNGTGGLCADSPQQSPHK